MEWIAEDQAETPTPLQEAKKAVDAAYREQWAAEVIYLLEAIEQAELTARLDTGRW